MIKPERTEFFLSFGQYNFCFFIQYLFNSEHGILVSFPVVVKYLGKSKLGEKGFVWFTVPDEVHDIIEATETGTSEQKAVTFTFFLEYETKAVISSRVYA